jgi:DNA ligase-1
MQTQRIVKLKSVKKLNFSFDKYDIEVEGNHNYFANGILVHNCRCITIATRKSDIGDDKYDIKFMSRQGKEFKTLGNVKPAIESILDYIFNSPCNGELSKYSEANSIVFDGELCILDENGDEHFDWAVSAISRKDYTIPSPCYNIFDILTLEEFNMEKESSIFSVRDNYLSQIFNDTNATKFKTVKHVKQERINSQEDFDRWTQYVKDGGWEGFMLRKDDVYKNDRTKDLIKVKKFNDFETVVKSVETGKVVYNEGGNKEYDVVTAIVIEYKGNNVSVGSGISKEQRIEWFKNPSKIIGKTVTIQYFEETKNKNNDLLSLRFPVLKYVYENGRDS